MSARPTLLFLHGWGFDASFWDPLRALLSDWPQRTMDRGYFGDHVATQLGAQNGKQCDECHAPSDAPVQLGSTALEKRVDEKIIIIGHSFGFMDAVMSLAAPTDGSDGAARDDTFSSRIGHPIALISINGFTRFSGASDFPEGVSPRVIERMMTKIRSAPEAVVTDFRQRCGSQNVPAAPSPTHSPTLPSALPPAKTNVERLLADLQTLRHGDARDAYRGIVAASMPCLVLAGAEDAIVPATMTRAAFADQHIVWHDHGDHLMPTSATTWCAQQIHAFLKTLPFDALRDQLHDPLRDQPHDPLRDQLRDGRQERLQ